MARCQGSGLERGWYVGANNYAFFPVIFTKGFSFCDFSVYFAEC